MKYTYFATIFVASALATTFGAKAQEIVCDSTYTTQRGDSLSQIAERAYGNSQAYQNIFSVNPGALTSPNIVPTGIDLFIPCVGEAAVTAQNASGELPAIKASQSDNIKVLTGTDYPPYVSNELPEGGFSTELLHRALQSGGQPADYRIDVIADWSAHLDPLLSGDAYDIGYPWFKPDCADTSNFGEGSKFRCDNLIFSRPLHEIVVTFIGRAGEVESIKAASDARGLTVCRPAGYFTHDLEAVGLVEPFITRIEPTTPEDCFEALAAREADLVSVNADTADRILREMEMAERTVEVIDLSSIQTLHAVGMRSNPRTRIIMRRIDQGLKKLQESRDFQKVAAKHL